MRICSSLEITDHLKIWWLLTCYKILESQTKHFFCKYIFKTFFSQNREKCFKNLFINSNLISVKCYLSGNSLKFIQIFSNFLRQFLTFDIKNMSENSVNFNSKSVSTLRAVVSITDSRIQWVVRRQELTLVLIFLIHSSLTHKTEYLYFGGV